MSGELIDPNKKYTDQQLVNINNQYKEIMTKDIVGKIQDLEEYKIRAEVEDKGLRTLVEEGFSHIEEAIKTFSQENKEHHCEIIKHQQHTNGDVSDLKIWRAGLAGGLAVILACGGFITTYFFIDKGEQKESNKQVIILKEQVTMLNDKLNDLELVK